MQDAAKRILAETDGKFELTIFPSSQLGSDTDSLGQLRSGAIGFFTITPLILSTLIPAVSITGTGFAFANYDAVWKAVDGPLGTYVRNQIGKSGLVVMDKMLDNGFRQITTSTKPIVHPEDLRNLRIRVPPSPLLTSLFGAFGSNPASINFNELYSSLQTKLVDAQENPLSVIFTNKIYEVQKYCSLINHNWDGLWLLANRRSWEQLPDDVKKIVAQNLNEATMLEREDVAKLNASVQADLTSKGLIFNRVDAEPFRDTLRKSGYYGDWKKKYGDEAWAILAEATGQKLD